MSELRAIRERRWPALFHGPIFPAEPRSCDRRNQYHHRNRLLTISPHIPAWLIALVRKECPHASNRHLRLSGIQLIFGAAVFQGYGQQPRHVHRIVGASEARVCCAQSKSAIVAGIDDRRQRDGCYQRPRRNLRQTGQAFAFGARGRLLIEARSRFGREFLSIPAPLPSPGFCPRPPKPRHARVANQTWSASLTDPE
jgi:hypothetical protein